MATRRWYQWHVSSQLFWLALVLLAVIANVLPRGTEQPQDRVINSVDGMYYTGVEYHECGWPLAWSRWPMGGNAQYVSGYRWDSMFPDTSTVKHADVPVFHSYAWLAGDLLACVVFAGACAGLFEFRRRRRAGVLQFTLLDLGAATAVIALSIGAYRHMAEANYVIEEIEAANGAVTATWSGPTWLGSLRPVTVTEVIFGEEPTPRIRREVARWTELRQMSLLMVQLNNDKDLSWLSNLKQLEYLCLSSSEIGDAQLASLASLTELRTLDLDNNPSLTGGDELRHLRNLAKLVHLNLGNTQVDGVGFEHLAALKRLQRLYLFHAPVSTEGLAKLTALQDLRFLALMGVDSSDELGPVLTQFSALETLDVRYTKFDPSAAEHLVHLTELRTIEIAHTPLANHIEHRIQTRHPLYRVYDEFRADPWRYIEYGVWTYLLERGYHDFVRTMVRRELQQPRNHERRDPDTVFWLVPKVLPREEFMTQMKRLRSHPDPHNAKWTNLALAWGEYGFDPDLAKLCREALQLRRPPYWAKAVCFSYPEYAQAMLPELGKLLMRGRDVTYMVQALAGCDEQAMSPLRARMNQDMGHAIGVLQLLAACHSDQPWIDPFIAEYTTHKNAAIRQTAINAAKVRAARGSSEGDTR